METMTEQEIIDWAIGELNQNFSGGTTFMRLLMALIDHIVYNLPREIPDNAQTKLEDAIRNDTSGRIKILDYTVVGEVNRTKMFVYIP